MSRVFFFLYYRVRAHFFAGARTASFPISSLHLCHPNLLSPFPFINSVLPTKHLFDHDSTMMSYSNSLLFREAGSLIKLPVTVSHHGRFQASPHRHHCFPDVAVHDDRTRCNQSGPVT
jgi:hypothetical protein